MGNITMSPNLFRAEISARPVQQRKDETLEQYRERKRAWQFAESKNPLKGREFKTKDALRSAMEKHGMKAPKYEVCTFMKVYW